ncbi:microtubule associated protein-domain-containing protein [Auriculariales sp. MPI-PUGE-AT-0066]|nr:microtubule associated protein-domain-containing protein [Auriculariales sp. MPI-PUGE-AT-0066]
MNEMYSAQPPAYSAPHHSYPSPTNVPHPAQHDVATSGYSVPVSTAVVAPAAKPPPQPSTEPTTSQATALLHSLQNALNAQLAYLPQLHATLGLPPDAIAHDLDQLRMALLATAEHCVKQRQDEVDAWHARCAEVEGVCVGLVKVLGSHARSFGAAGSPSSIGEITKIQALPRRLELLESRCENLRRLYSSKLNSLKALHKRLAALIGTLGPGFYSSDLVKSIEATAEPANLVDVTPERATKLEQEVLRGRQEIQRRLSLLSELLEHITWLYTELGIPLPNPEDTTLAFTPSPAEPATYPQHDADMFAPPIVIEEPSPEHCARVFSQYVARLEEAADEGLETAGIEGVEPTLGLLLWAERVKTELDNLKTRRETTIQALYDSLESLWRRLGVPDEDADEFIEAHRGSTEETIQAYEEEFARMLEVRKERMGAFIESAREDIRGLWDDLQFSEDDMEGFAAMYDDNYSEDLLTEHEAEIARLKDERLTKAPVLTLFKKWHAVCEEGRQLALSAADQSRLLGRGPRGDPGRLLREEKMRKRVAKEKPKLIAELRNIIPAWEEENGRAFMIAGVRAIEVVEAEAEKDAPNKKRVAQKPNVVSARATTPAPSRNETNINGKRATPVTRITSTASSAQAPPTKRPRTTPSTQSRVAQTPSGRATPAQTPSANYGSSTSRKPIGSQNLTISTASKSMAVATPTPASAHAPRYNDQPTLGIGYPTAPSVKFGGQPMQPQGRVVTGRSVSTASSGSTAGLYARLSGRHRRDSFKPRASVDGWAEQVGILSQNTAWGGWDGDGLAEEEDEEEVDC